MIGIVIVTHGKLGKALVDTAEFVLGDPPDAVIAVSAEVGEPAEALRRKIEAGIRAVNRRKGVLILTDMYGGTPSDMSYAFLRKGHVDVLSAVNLPILLKAITARKHTAFSDLALCLASYGKQNISLASEILKGKKRSLTSPCPFAKGGLKHVRKTMCPMS